MFCPNCGNKISAVGNFCDACGHSLVRKKDNGSVTEAKNEKKAKEPADVLWDKSIEIIKAEGKKLEQYQKFYSDVLGELVIRLSTNSLNELLEQFKLDFDKQPYRVVESIKHYFKGLVINAYDVHLAKKLLENKDIQKADITDPEILAKEWGQVHLNFANKIMVVPDEVALVLSSINNQLSEAMFENNPSLKELPNAVIEELKSKFIQQLINGYLLGVAEDNIREQANQK